MKQKIQEKIEIPSGIVCEYQNRILKCKKDSLELSKKIDILATDIKIEKNEIIFNCEKGNKTHYKTIKTNVAHINNLFHGLQEPFEYNLESANVHFPMTLKVDGSNLQITNFLGEKIPRLAQILPNVEVEVKGQEIMVKSPDREAAGQTAANFESATKLKGRDRRIFQDGIFITSKPNLGAREK